MEWWPPLICRQQLKLREFHRCALVVAQVVQAVSGLNNPVYGHLSKEMVNSEDLPQLSGSFAYFFGLSLGPVWGLSVAIVGTCLVPLDI